MLSQRDCEKLIGSLIGGLLTIADPEDIMGALLRWTGDKKLWNTTVTFIKKTVSFEDIITLKKGGK